MGLAKYLRAAWKKPDVQMLRTRMLEWRKGNTIIKVEKPLRLDRARSLGYKAKKGFVVVRVRLLRGGRQRDRTNKGRRSKRHTIRKVLKMNYRWVSEGRAQKKFENLEVLNSYFLAKDGKHYFYEVIMVDSSKQEIKKDRTLRWITKGENKNRAQRGLTSAGKKSRGLRSKSHDLKVRPSLRAWGRQGK